MPSIAKARWIRGNRLRFRNAEVTDAEFILGLRTNPEISKYISKVDPSLEKQIQWLVNYQSAQDQAYFIIENERGENVGTVRFYDPQGSSLCWGSWIIVQGSSRYYAIESALMAWHYAFYALDFDACHFDVVKENRSVWQFHMSFGAKRVGETERDFLFNVTKEDVEPALHRFGKYLPNSIEVEFLDKEGMPSEGKIVRSRFVPLTE